MLSYNGTSIQNGILGKKRQTNAMERYLRFTIKLKVIPFMCMFFIKDICVHKLVCVYATFGGVHEMFIVDTHELEIME